jgi:hypothetical protein
MHWYVENEIMLTNQDEYRVYLYYWNEMNVKMGYGIAPKKINTRDISILYGTDSKNYPCIQWGFSNGWEMFYDYLAGLEAEGVREKHTANLDFSDQGSFDNMAISMLDLTNDKVCEEIKATDINTLTPIEAMNLIFEWKKRLM